MNVRPVRKNVFASQTANGLDNYFDALGNDFYSLYSSLKDTDQICEHSGNRLYGNHPKVGFDRLTILHDILRFADHGIR